MKMDGQMETAHSFRPQRPEDTGCRAPAHTGSRSASSHPPSWRRGPAVGLNRGRPDGAHGADNQSAAVCPPKPRHCGGKERGPALTLLRRMHPARHKQHWPTSVSGAHPRLVLLFSLAVELLVYWHPDTGRTTSSHLLIGHAHCEELL